MCSVCGPFALRRQGNGTITREERARHFSSEGHQSAVRRERERELERERNEAKQARSDFWHALLLSIVATRLRAQHESVEDARVSWLLESVT